MTRSTAVSAALALAILATAAAGDVKPMPRLEYARAARNRAGIKESDVCLSYRFHRPDHTIQELIRDWKPTRIEWSYSTDPATIKAVHDAGLPFVGTLNTIAFEGPEQDAELFDGSRACAPWMTSFNNGKGAGWACVNKPITLANREKHLKQYLDPGVDTIQHDDWMFSLHAYSWGACYCTHCMSGFAAYLADHATPDDMANVGVTTWDGFNYRDYIKSTFGCKTNQELLASRAKDPLAKHFRLFQLLGTRRYFDDLLAFAQETGRPIKLTVNSNASLWMIMNDFLLDKLDYMVGETAFMTSTDLWGIFYNMKLADALNIPQILSPKTAGEISVRATRRATALTYALGHRLLIPWDVYVSGTAPRWFGRPEEYGDLYAFVRANAHLLDGYKPAADVVIASPLAWNQSIAANAREIARYLARAGCPCRFSVYGTVGEIVHVPVDPADFTNARAAVVLRLPGTAPEDEAALASALANLPKVELDVAPKLDYRAICDQIARLCPPTYKMDSRGIVALPRVKPGSPAVVHLVNLGSAPAKTTAWLSDRICSRATTRATLLQPGKQPETFALTPERGGLRTPEFTVDLWGLLVFQAPAL